MDRVYLDHAATTPLDPRVLEAMMPYLRGYQANPNSLHKDGREAFQRLEELRHEVATSLGAKTPDEVLFNGGGTEGDVAALFGLIAARRSSRPARIIVSAIEHHAVLEPARRLAASGHKVIYLRPACDGIIDPVRLSEAIDDETDLVSIMYANNETGAIQPVRELAAIAHEHGALFHTDAVQALGKCPMGLEGLGVDAASFSTHKVYGPKGCGVLYLRRGVPFVTQMPGGGQEGGRRSGTQNLAAAEGTATALRMVEAGRQSENERLRGIQTSLVEGALNASSRVSLTVDPRTTPGSYLPNIVSLLVEGMESETLILRLDAAGFEVSAASACSSGSLEPSHVLTAMGISRDLAFGSLRVSLGRQTTADQVAGFTEALAKVIH